MIVMSKRRTNNSKSSDLFNQLPVSISPSIKPSKRPKPPTKPIKPSHLTDTKEDWNSSLDILDFLPNQNEILTDINSVSQSSSIFIDPDPLNFDVTKPTSPANLSSYLNENVTNKNVNYSYLNDTLSTINNIKNIDLQTCQSSNSAKSITGANKLPETSEYKFLSKKAQQEQLKLNKKLLRQQEKEAKLKQKQLERVARLEAKQNRVRPLETRYYQPQIQNSNTIYVNSGLNNSDLFHNGSFNRCNKFCSKPVYTGESMSNFMVNRQQTNNAIQYPINNNLTVRQQNSNLYNSCNLPSETFYSNSHIFDENRLSQISQNLPQTQQIEIQTNSIRNPLEIMPPTYKADRNDEQFPATFYDRSLDQIVQNNQIIHPQLLESNITEISFTQQDFLSTVEIENSNEEYLASNSVDLTELLNTTDLTNILATEELNGFDNLLPIDLIDDNELVRYIDGASGFLNSSINPNELDDFDLTLSWK